MSGLAESLRRLFCSGLLLMLTGSAEAEPPAISAIFPPGVQRGLTTELTLTGKPGTGPIHAAAEEPGFVSLTVSEKGDKLTVETAPDCRPGLHWIRFYNAEDAASPVPLWVGTLPELSETEPNNLLEEARKPGSVTLPIVINGTLHKSEEVDSFPVTLARGQTLIASLTAHRGLGSPMDGVLQILDSKGNVLAQNDDDHGWDPLLDFAVPVDGDYFVRVFAFPADPNSSINFAGGADYVYRLTLTTGPFVTHALPIRSGEQTVTVPQGWNLDAASPGDPRDLPGLHQFHDEFTADSPIAGLASPEPASLPVAVFGTITADRRSFGVPVRLLKSQPVRVRVPARQLDSLLDPVLTIRDASGKSVKSMDDVSKDNLDIDLNWTPPADGTYTFEVIDRYRHFGDRYFCVLQVTEDRPRYELSVEKDHYVVKPDKPLELTVNVNRQSGFKQEFRISVEGLPEGVMCEPVLSAKEGDSSKKPVLKISTHSTTGFQGPIRIVSETIESAPSQMTTAVLKFGGKKTQNIWLTVTPAPAQAANESSSDGTKSP